MSDDRMSLAVLSTAFAQMQTAQGSSRGIEDSFMLTYQYIMLPKYKAQLPVSRHTAKNTPQAFSWLHSDELNTRTSCCCDNMLQ
jgi:hypothetical protein